jgi:hypothetical protein
MNALANGKFFAFSTAQGHCLRAKKCAKTSSLSGSCEISQRTLFFVPHLKWRKSEAKPVRRPKKRSLSDYSDGGKAELW